MLKKIKSTQFFIKNVQKWVKNVEKYGFCKKKRAQHHAPPYFYD